MSDDDRAPDGERSPSEPPVENSGASVPLSTPPTSIPPPPSPSNPQATPPPPPPAPSIAPTDIKPDDQRKKMLAQAMQAEVVTGGRVESQQDFQAVLIHGKPVNHILHLIVSLFTCGLWVFGWLALVIVGGEKRVMIVIDEYGNILRQTL